MDDNCPATPLIVTETDSKSPLQIAISSPEPEDMKSPSRDSPDSHCVICLGKLQNKSFTDSCLHQFCFQCLLQWSKVKAECPLCKQPFKSIIHNVRSNLDYDQYHIEPGESHYVLSDFMHSFNFDLIPVDRRFRYRSTMTREYFRELAESFLARNSIIGDDYYQIPPIIPVDASSSQNLIRNNWLYNSLHQRSRQRGTTEFRKNIYARDLWVQDLVDVSGRYRECTPQFYRENPAQIHRIIPWLNREVNVLLNECESHGAYILTQIISILSQHSIRSREFRELVAPYFGSRTDHFIHELYTFAHSVYDISGFDQHAVYGPNPNYATEVQEISSSSEGSDIEILQTIKMDKKRLKKPFKVFKRDSTKKVEAVDTGFDEPVAGPSGLNLTNLSKNFDACDSDPDEIKVLDYIKPEPELVILSSGEEEPIISENDFSKSLECLEVIPNKKNTSTRTRLSSYEDYVLPNEKIKNKSYKGKCKSNGIGLKGKQKQKYIKSRHCRSSSSESTSTFTSNSSKASLSSHKSSYKLSMKTRKKKSKSSRKKCKRKSVSKTSNSCLEKKKRKLSDLDVEKEKNLKSKKRVKSCVIIPTSKSNSFLSYDGCKVSSSFERYYCHNDDLSSPPSYWSINSGPEEIKPLRRGGENTFDSSQKTVKIYDWSSDERSIKRIRDSSSLSDSSTHSSESIRKNSFSEYSKTSTKLKSVNEKGKLKKNFKRSKTENSPYGCANINSNSLTTAFFSSCSSSITSPSPSQNYSTSL